MKYFIITIDTEGDNLWDWRIGKIINTENVSYLNRFQELCNTFSFKPVWLTNYEMLSDQRYVNFIKNVVKENKGECGMHLHAWNTPPFFQLPYEKDSQPSYLIEYPYEIMEKKIKTMTELIKDKVGINPVSHRAGRWAMNQDYFSLLSKYGYKIDCSVTPGVNWEDCKGQTKGSKGVDYSNAKNIPYYERGNLIEVPMTIKKIHKIYLPKHKTIKSITKSIYYGLKGQNIWLRPDGNNIRKMLDIVRDSGNNCNYVMFMLHSSELMPGGSPTFRSVDDIEKLYKHLYILFNEVIKKFNGITLSDYYDIAVKRINGEYNE